jgi:NADH dehydrogenase
MRVAVTGANSSVGINLLGHLIRGPGFEVIACVRSERAASALPWAPQISTEIVSYGDAENLATAMEGASVIVHLAGILIESRASKYANANTAATAAVAEAAKRVGAEHIVFTSALGADPRSSNGYLRSKGEGEVAVAGFGGGATIIRTPILLGPKTAGADGILRTVSQAKARLLGGGSHVLRPLDIDDLSRAIVSVCAEPPEGVRVLELVGPEPVRYHDLIRRIATMLGREIDIAAAPIWAAKLAAAVRSRLVGGGVTPGVIDVITASETVEHNADAELGVTLTPLNTTLEKTLTHEQQAE